MYGGATAYSCGLKTNNLQVATDAKVAGGAGRVFNHVAGKSVCYSDGGSQKEGDACCDFTHKLILLIR